MGSVQGYLFLYQKLTGRDIMNSNWFKVLMKMTKVQYGDNLLLKGFPIIFNKKGATLKLGKHVSINSGFLSNLVGLYDHGDVQQCL